MVAIRVIFDGKAFVPQEPVTLPDRCEALVIIDQADLVAQARLDADIRAYYQSTPDGEDDTWGKATAPQSRRAWDED